MKNSVTYASFLRNKYKTGDILHVTHDLDGKSLIRLYGIETKSGTILLKYQVLEGNLNGGSYNKTMPIYYISIFKRYNTFKIRRSKK